MCTFDHMLPFTPVADDDLVDLRRRLEATRPARLPQGLGWERGTDVEVLAGLIEYWCEGFDWRTHEARLLDLGWQVVGDMHVVHRPAEEPDAPVVVLLHGWPDSVMRFERALPLLHDLTVVLPALPGFPFAAELTQPGTNVVAMASMVAEAMQSLGYDRYVVSGGDVGGDVAEQLAALYPDRVAALHLTNVSPRHAAFADRATLDAESLAYLDEAVAWQRSEGAYIAVQATRPHTLAPGLADSPAGLAAWLVEKLQAWSDTPFEDDDLLAWTSAYWFTGTIGTSFGPYAEPATPVPYVSTPTLLSAFPRDIKPMPATLAATFVNVHERIQHTSGGHFAAWEQPAEFVDDLRLAVELGQRSGIGDGPDGSSVPGC